MRGLVLASMVFAVLLSGHTSQAQEATGLDIEVRSLDGQGVAGVTLLLTDADGTAHTGTTDARGMVTIAPLPGAFAHITAATQQNQPLHLTTNDRSGGMRVRLRSDRRTRLEFVFDNGTIYTLPTVWQDAPDSPFRRTVVPQVTTSPTALAVRPSSEPTPTAPAIQGAESVKTISWLWVLLALLLILAAGWGLRRIWRSRQQRGQR